MANFCPVCGTRLDPQARFCSNCGKRIPVDDSYVSSTPVSPVSGAPMSGPPMSGTPAPGSFPDRQKGRGKKGRKGGRLIPLVLLAVFAVMAFIIPRFNISGPGEKDDGSDLEKVNIGPNDPLFQYRYDENSIAKLPTKTEDIRLRYSKEDLEKAPVMTADVSISDPTAVLEDIRVDLKGWNLESEED